MISRTSRAAAMAAIIVLASFLAVPCFGQEQDTVASTRGVVGGQVIGGVILGPGGFSEDLLTLQGKKPAVFTGFSFDPFYLDYDEFTIGIFKLVGKGKKAKWQLMAEASGIHPVLTVTPAKTAQYLVVVYNPNDWIIAVRGWSN